jgi:hypothetical protein
MSRPCARICWTLRGRHDERQQRHRQRRSRK